MTDEIIQNSLPVENSGEVKEVPIETPVEEILETSIVNPPIDSLDTLPVSEGAALEQSPVVSEPIKISENQNNSIQDETNILPEVILEKQTEQPIVDMEGGGGGETSATMEASKVDSAISDSSEVITESSSIESTETPNENAESINPVKQAHTEQAIKKEEVEIPKEEQPKIQKFKQENIVLKSEQAHASPFLCNSLSDKFLKNMKNFKEIGKIGRETILLRKQKRLDKIMTLFLDKNHIVLSDVEKFLRVTEKTASRYIGELKKQNKIKKSGKDDRGAFLYVKI